MGRTDSMPEAHGLNKLFRPLRYHEASRQWFAVVFVPLVSYFGQPNRELLIAGSIVAVIGHLCSSATLAAMPIYFSIARWTPARQSQRPTEAFMLSLQIILATLFALRRWAE